MWNPEGVVAGPDPACFSDGFAGILAKQQIEVRGRAVYRRGEQGNLVSLFVAELAIADHAEAGRLGSRPLRPRVLVADRGGWGRSGHVLPMVHARGVGRPADAGRGLWFRRRAVG